MQFKNFTLCALAVVTSLLIFSTSCKKSNSSSNNVTATVGTTAFSGGTTQAVYVSSFGLLGIISYNVNNKDTSGFNLTLPLNVKVGHAFSGDSTALDVTYQAPGGKVYDASGSQATATITSLDSTGHKISGTFSGVAYASLSDSLVITNGKFSTSYSVQ